MLSPRDIASKTFRTAVRGYDRQEVDAFLQAVAGELGLLLSSAASEAPTEDEALSRRLDAIRQASAILVRAREEASALAVDDRRRREALAQRVAELQARLELAEDALRRADAALEQTTDPMRRAGL